MARRVCAELLREQEQAFIGLVVFETLPYILDDVFEQFDEARALRSQVKDHCDAVVSVDVVGTDRVVEGPRCVRPMCFDVLQKCMLDRVVDEAL